MLLFVFARPERGGEDNTLSIDIINTLKSSICIALLLNIFTSLFNVLSLFKTNLLIMHNHAELIIFCSCCILCKYPHHHA